MAKNVTLSDEAFTMLQNVVEGRLGWYNELLAFPESEPGRHDEVKAKIARMERVQLQLNNAQTTEDQHE
jgi:hypothetical protein